MRNRRLSLPELSEQTGIGLHDLRRVIDGDEPVTEAFAERFRDRFGRVADNLLVFQFTYDFYRAEGRRPTPDEIAARGLAIRTS